MKKLFLIIFFFGFSAAGFCQLKSYSFEEIAALQQIQKRKIVVFIHTDWCQFCQRMNATTFKNQEIIEKLNSDFYFISFNAEEQRTITFNHHSFKYQPSGYNVGVHELALQLGTQNNQIVYPVLCVLNDKNEIIFQYSSYLSAKDLKLLLDNIEN
ncbi:thioredoxin family protein [Flavobacterium chungbukense]|nr:thioredoxin family protein [Flavobacterium chungbukense]MCC4922134.1 thioredoxin family protein [Flavobacterium chungbukense]